MPHRNAARVKNKKSPVPLRVSSRIVAADVRRRISARETLPPSRRASVSASLRRDRAEARGEGGKAPLRRDGGPPRYLGGYDSCEDSRTHPDYSPFSHPAGQRNLPEPCPGEVVKNPSFNRGLIPASPEASFARPRRWY